MKISYNWLKQFLHIDWEAERTAELLTDLGLEVEGIDDFVSVPGGLEGVVVGLVNSCEPHPNADRLKLTTVDIGGNEELQIVCGAPNVAAGQKVPVAAVGTTLYDTEGKPWKIKKGKIRGEVSMGMICAEDELGLGSSHDGIMVLDKGLKVGTALSEVFDVETDQVFEIGLTPNRTDAMSHWGVARDLRAGLLQHEVQLELITPSTSSFKIDNRSLRIDVDVKRKDLAPRYCGLTISGLKVGESPNWLQSRLKAIGLAPINNVVDATNYVLHELGQPLHAFDADKIAGQKIEVKTLKSGTKFETLDGVVRTLDSDDLMICDAEGPMCIAGVFGGINSGVTEKTSRIFLESAYFDPVSIRRTAKRHGLNTDASFRFERGVDPDACEYALLRAALLICEIAGGEISSDVTDLYPNKIEGAQVVLNFENAFRLIGQELPREIVKDILTSLEIKINNVTESGIGMTIPPYRRDVTREADVVEEVLRVYGFNRIQPSSKLNASLSSTGQKEDHGIQNVIAAHLSAKGFYEIMTNSLTSPQYAKLSEHLKDEHNVPIINPLSQDLSVMRQSMLFGAMESLVYNTNRQNPNVKLFEFGKTYHRYQNETEEKKRLILLAAGERTSDSWTGSAKPTDFFYFKGLVASILQRLGIVDFNEKDHNTPVYAEGLRFMQGKHCLVEFGLVNKQIRTAFDLDRQVLFADFNWDLIITRLPKKNFALNPIPKFPSVKRDFALLLDENVAFSNLRDAAFRTEKKILREVALFDVYTGKNLPDGKKSYALSFSLQDERKTLTDKQIDKTMARLQQCFEKDFGATLR